MIDAKTVADKYIAADGSPPMSLSSDFDRPLWSIMTKSRGGTVSVIRDLTLEQCKRTYERLDPWYGHHSESLVVHRGFLPDGCFGASSSGCGSMRQCNDGDIETREVFGPPGWGGFRDGDIEYWPKFHHVYTDNEWNVLPDEYQDEPKLAQRYRAEQERMRHRKTAGKTDVHPEAAPRPEIKDVSTSAPADLFPIVLIACVVVGLVTFGFLITP